AYFRVRAVDVVGTHYVAPRAVVARLHVDTTASVWDDLGVLQRRVVGLEGVQSVRVERSLPGTLVVRVTESVPVALAPTPGGLLAVDAGGHLLPLDPARADVDLPVVARPDPQVLRLLAGVRAVAPALYALISAVRRDGAEDLVVTFPDGVVRARADATPERLADIGPVRADLARRRLAYAELDLRYRDQVVARLK
ncbi:MAG TPA: FtsQ-type POTRA domain-containing protein, partial [Gemmatimonadaceae bacterium]|nr:FtsQ-type POTRA domain-containing protein [Gemmatimonadaceae bacterium]